MIDLSYFEEPVEVLVTDAVWTFEGGAMESTLLTAAVYETQQQTRKRPQQVSHTDLERIIYKHSGAPKHLDRMIDLEQETTQWSWFDKYQDHLARVEEVEAWNTLNAGTDGGGVEIAPRELPGEPVRPTILLAAQWRENNFSILRQASYGTWQVQLELLYDDQKNGTARFRDAIEETKAKYNKPGVI